VEELLPKMDDDSRIKRLREFVQLYLRRTMIMENKDEKLRIKFLPKKSSSKLGESKNASGSKRRSLKNSKNKYSNIRNQKIYREEIKEEIGRSYDSVDNNPIQGEKIFSDLKIEIYPVGKTFMASIEDKNGKKISKLFRDEESADVWVRNNSLNMSNKFTQ